MGLRETLKRISKGFQCWMQASEHHSKIVENPAESVSLELASEASVFWQPTVLQNPHIERDCVVTYRSVHKYLEYSATIVNFLKEKARFQDFICSKSHYK